ncbi:hypothetical protein ACVWYF_000842 [Hymenobacter sp. UYAg731]
MRGEESYLKLGVVWKDEHMLEIEFEVRATFFSGITQAYDTSESFYDLANQLKDFPNNINTIIYQAGKKDGYSYCSLTFYPIGISGFIGIYIQLEENVSTEYRAEEKSKLSLELIVEPNAIDNFRNQLIAIAQNKEGNALIQGR